MTGRCISLLSLTLLGLCAILALPGCATHVSVPASELQGILANIQVADPPTIAQVSATETSYATLSPFSVRDSSSPDWAPPQPWDLSIDEAIQIALSNSTVLRDLGARVIQTPGLTPTIYGPAIQATDPTSGVEAALSEFDARVNGDLFYEDNDRVLNNEFVGGGVNFFEQDLTRMNASLSKQTASGALFTIRHNFDADLNNSDRNLLTGRAWNWDFEGEVRHPLLQGRGVSFNRIAGPNATPGVYNGVVIARVNADITVAQLEIALRDYLSNVENAYWDLHFAYADLEVKMLARNRSLNTYQLLKARRELAGAEKDKLAQAKEQYFRFEQDVQNALAGRLIVGTRAFNGSGGGTFQGIGGVYVNERRLRMIMGLPINDGRLIRTSSKPTIAPLTYDWDNVVANALSRRTELRRQRLNVDRRRYELTASRNFLMPRLDAVGRYRYRALGESLYDRNIPITNQSAGTGTHEWLMGLSLSYPVGYRQAYSGVRNAQLRLSREQALLAELERQVVYGLSNAIAESDRAYAVLRVAINRENAAREQYEILNNEAQEQVRQFDFNALLDSEQRFAESSTSANRVRVQYALATKNLNFEMGALLEFYNIHLAEDQRGQPIRRPPGHLRRLIRSVAHRAGKTVDATPGKMAAVPTSETVDLSAVFTESLVAETMAAETTPTESMINEIIKRDLSSGETIVNQSTLPSEATEYSPSDLDF